MAGLNSATPTISNAGIRRVVGEFPSRKNRAPVIAESRVERKPVTGRACRV